MLSSFTNNHRGFTLVELLVVMGILSIIITAVIAYLNPVKQISKAKDSKRALELDQIKKALDIYYNDNGCYPVTVPFGQKWTNTSGRTIYMERVPDDSANSYDYFSQPSLGGGGGPGCPQWYTLFAKLDLKPDNQLAACPLDANAGANCVPSTYGAEGYNYTCKTSSNADCSVSTITGGGGSSLPLTCYVDNDRDGLALLYAPSNMQPIGVRACPLGFTKRAPTLAVNTSYDCDDTTNTITIPQTYYRDGDGDNYIDQNNTNYACPNQSILTGYISLTSSRGVDCDDGNSNAYANFPEYTINPPVCDPANISKYKCTTNPPSSPDPGYSYTASGLNKTCTPSDTSGTFARVCVDASASTCSSINQFGICSTTNSNIIMCPQASLPVANVSKCVNKNTDNSNCGSCGTVCPQGSTCSSGSCICASSSLSYCGGACVNLLTDTQNCGACGNPCTAVGAVCSSGACVNPRRVFVTSTLYNGNLGGIWGGDAKCQEKADNAGLGGGGGKWRAWISSSTVSAKNRFRHFNVPYKLLDGTLIANNWTDLTDGTLQNPINKDENSGRVESYAWTGTDSSGGGTSGRTCVDFSTAEGVAAVGITTRMDNMWTNGLFSVSNGQGGYVGGNYQFCSSLYRLYCFEDLPAFSPDTNNSLEKNLVNYWKMEEAPGTLNDSVGARTILNNTGAIASSRGIAGNAVLFNGSDSVGQISSVINEPMSTSQTFQAWFKGTDARPGPNTSVVKNPVFGTTYGLNYISLGVDEGRISYASSYSAGTAWGNNTVTDGNWHHLVWVNNNGRLFMYVDGESDGDGSVPTGIYLRFDYIGIAGSASVQTHLNGSIDELAYWRRALTPAEIRDLYNSGRGNTYKGGQ